MNVRPPTFPFRSQTWRYVGRRPVVKASRTAGSITPHFDLTEDNIQRVLVLSPETCTYKLI